MNALHDGNGRHSGLAPLFIPEHIDKTFGSGNQRGSNDDIEFGRIQLYANPGMDGSEVQALPPMPPSRFGRLWKLRERGN
jgi:hypothetical protein